MRQSPSLSFAVAALSAAVLAAGPVRAELIETRTFEESMPTGEGALRVVVDNVFGSIRVTAHDRASLDMVAAETIRADTQSDLERARTEIGLRTERNGDEIAFVVRRLDGECECDCCRWNRWDGYAVAYDIELNVPRDASLDLSTVNDGEIVVEGVRGDFEVGNVNGPVTLRGLRGSGHASTVNGRIDASFERAPQEGTSFKTVNGRIDVAFPRGLSADLQFMTARGEIWTDFDAEPLALGPLREEARDGGRLVIRAEARSAIRVGAGGPTHAFETLNGEIYVRRAQR